MTSGFVSPKYPELFFGLSGPIGVDIDAITRLLAEGLERLGYRSSLVKITELTAKIPSEEHPPLNPTFYNVMRYKMAHASRLCRNNKDASYLMRLAVAQIAKERESFLGSPSYLSTFDDEIESVVSQVNDSDNILSYYTQDDQEQFAGRSAYIIRQIKRPEEVTFLRQLYRDQFFLISAFGSESDRIASLRDKIRRDANGNIKQIREAYLASKLVELDAEEGVDQYGQHTRDAFHLADVVIDGIDRLQMKGNINRFLDALFGANDIAPTKPEFGMAAANLASLRSSDLSRQVGAALLSGNGELLAQGCNEVPKAFGGTYWDGELPDHRDIKLGSDSNDILKIDVLADLVERFLNNGLFAESVTRIGKSKDIVNGLIGRGSHPAGSAGGVLKGSKILDLTEYGRVVHAEMNAICDAARLGQAIRGARLYTTTFPCHNCTKHILASGISEVVFLEPYPKSKAQELHRNEIAIEGTSTDKVNFKPFLGITPRRYRDFFLKTKRKKDGQAVRWQHGGPAPLVDILSTDYISIERFASVPCPEAVPTPSPAPTSGPDQAGKEVGLDDATGDYRPDGP